jgi:hypothetical protein
MAAQSKSPDEHERDRMNAKTIEVPVLTPEQLIAAVQKDRRKGRVA